MAESEQRRPPSVDRLARSLAGCGLPHQLLVDIARSAIAAGTPDAAADLADAAVRRLLQPVINATGVLLHTNLGRAPFAHDQPAAASNLELDLLTGKRGDRYAGVGPLFAAGCGAEAAMVVNNGAAAVLLALAAVAAGRGVAVSRGESVEIGGGFRIPEIAAQSGARLVDVGTTNRTRRDDFARAVHSPELDVGCILRVHPSNFRVEGFASSVSIGELADLPVPIIADIGSGLLDARCPWLDEPPPLWLAGEPAARQTLADGASLVTFSTDKLLGGPQGGVIAGSAELIERCRRHPLARVLRPGATILGALQAVILDHLRRDVRSIPLWRMATVPPDELERRAEAIVRTATADHDGATPPVVVPTTSIIGAGSAPGAGLASFAVAIDGDHSSALRRHTPPVLARVERHTTLCDVRTVEPSSDAELARAIAAIGRRR